MQRRYLLSVGAIALISVVHVGCGSSDSKSPDAATTIPSNLVYPQLGYTGVDGTHTFKAFAFTTVVNATWEVSDPSLASVQNVACNAFLIVAGAQTCASITANKPGAVTLTAKGANGDAPTMFTIAQYDAAVTAVGEKRYNTPDNPSATRQACATCHGGANGVNHSPVVTDSMSDSDLLNVVITGKFPSGQNLSVTHTWDLTEAEKAGIVPYLRQLPLRL